MKKAKDIITAVILLSAPLLIGVALAISLGLSADLCKPLPRSLIGLLAILSFLLVACSVTYLCFRIASLGNLYVKLAYAVFVGGLIVWFAFTGVCGPVLVPNWISELFVVPFVVTELYLCIKAIWIDKVKAAILVSPLLLLFGWGMYRILIQCYRIILGRPPF